MIPKIIHMCWLGGGEYSELTKKCLLSWKKKLPDYEIVLWNKERIEKESPCLWLQQACQARKWAFAADFVRFYALYHYGGIYLDTDVEVLRPFDDLLEHREFVGYEASDFVETAVLGAEKGIPWVKECLDYYEGRPFIMPNGKYDMKPVPYLLTRVIAKYPDVKILPFYYFSPKDYNIGRFYSCAETYCVHHFNGAWVRKGIRYGIKRFLHWVLYAFIGRDGHNRIIKALRKI